MGYLEALSSEELLKVSSSHHLNEQDAPSCFS